MFVVIEPMIGVQNSIEIAMVAKTAGGAAKVSRPKGNRPRRALPAAEGRHGGGLLLRRVAVRPSHLPIASVFEMRY